VGGGLCFLLRLWAHASVNIEDRIETATGLAWKSLDERDASLYLVAMIDTLVAISDAYQNGDSARVRKLASGLGILATAEDYTFLNSDLGGLVTDIVVELSE
jgi:hypothetical protein